MSYNSEPSPLSLGPPDVPLRPQPPAPAHAAARGPFDLHLPPIRMTNSISPDSPAVPSLPQPPDAADPRPPGLHLPPLGMVSSVSLSARFSAHSAARPATVQNLSVLSEFLRARPADGGEPRVIAVDGLDRNAVQMMIANLYHHISRDPRFTVRVMSESHYRPPTDPSAAMLFYLRQIRDWGQMWQVVLGSPAMASDTRTPFAHRQSSPLPPCLWILPLSPLMATMRVANHVAMTGTYGTVDLWRWLSSHWQGHIRPDITINIQEMADTSRDREVLRYSGSNMNTLVVTKVPGPGVEITPKQYRRVAFEVEEWLFCWLYGEEQD